MLISTHMQDLKDTTQDVHYENFRAQCISQISQHALRERAERGKLKRESISSHNDTSITETDRLLLQKDEEVNIKQHTLQISKKSFAQNFSIKLMIVIQMWAHFRYLQKLTTLVKCFFPFETF